MSVWRGDSDPGDRSATDAAPVEMTVLSGDPTAREIAAITAVLSAVAQETEDEARLEGIPTRNAWERSQVAVRQPRQWGHGGWADATRG